MNNKKNVKLTLVPNTNLAKQNAAYWSSAEEPVMVVENLYLLPKSTLGKADSSKTNIEYASKVIRSVSAMTGLEYYSNSKKKWDVLYKEVYSIKGPKDRTRIADDTAGNADGKILYCMQDDSSFGKINYRLEYHQTQEEVSACFANTTPLYAGPIKAVSEGNLRISLDIIDCGESFMVYMLVQAKFPVMPLMEDTMNESLSARLDAIYRWFTQQF